jgi:hypothetical protein
MSNIKPIAFYLPQYHPIPENDEWWGKGFTEWTNVTKAKPLFKGHYQPRLPAELGFYDLRVPEVRKRQAELARENGIYGFCYYHYWFGDGKLLLERPINEVQLSKEPDFPFCFCWANETWEGRWYGVINEKRTLIEQKYNGVLDYVSHFNYLKQFFLDERYIKIDGKPLFQIYCPHLVPDLDEFMSVFNKEAYKIGLPGIHFMGGQKTPISFLGSLDSRISSSFTIAFEQAKKSIYKLNSLVNSNKLFFKFFKGKINFGFFNKVETYDYEQFIKVMDKVHDLDAQSCQAIFPIVINDFDNTARAGERGIVLNNSNPLFFKSHLLNAEKSILKNSLNEKIIFVKSWNEWAEGNYLESDLKWGNEYLKAFKRFL